MPFFLHVFKEQGHGMDHEDQPYSNGYLEVISPGAAAAEQA